ncbi:paraquat-inducible protein A [Pleionea sediminis]|uniref:paraquat-inducible protein A n=1 Tax=Pleionea sediminis TaxID=2569479 RepID=UPI001185FB1E|nr:paraquat-inducible protein A [Pleionea sediminis]
MNRQKVLPTTYLKVLLIFSLMSYLLGISLPLFTLQKLLVFKDSFSILGGIWVLTSQKEFFLAAILFAFSLVMPLLKFWYSLRAMSCELGSDEHRVFANRLLYIGKWSMADVFVISIIASTIKFTGLATVKVHIGIVFFALSVITSMFLTSRLLKPYELTVKKSLNKNER